MLLVAFFEAIVALAVVGTAVALFPVVKKQNEGVAPGYVGLRTLAANTMSLRIEFLAVSQQDGASVGELCRRFGISSKTAYQCTEMLFLPKPGSSPRDPFLGSRGA